MLTRAKTIIFPTATPIHTTNSVDLVTTTKNEKKIQSQSAHAPSVALHQSILNGRLKQVKYLLKLGSKVDIKDMYGRTCLMLACLSDQEEYGLKLAKLLLHYGADMNMQDYMGRSAICLACGEKREKIVELFVDKNSNLVDFRQKDNDGNILLNYAAMLGTPKMVKLIVDKMNSMYIPIDQRNNLGYTALLLAVKNKRWSNAYILLTHGMASPFLKDNEYFYNAIEWIIKTNQADNDLQSLSISNENYRFRDKNNQTNKAANNNSNNVNDLANTLSSSFTDFQNDFQLNKSNTLLSFNTPATNSGYFKQQINYKTWYGIPNPYHECNDLILSKCEHIPFKNYSIDHHKSTYTPAIFTPRVTPRASNRMQRQATFVNETENYNNDDNNDTEVLFKLMDKLQEKMTNTAPSQGNTAPSTPLSSAGQQLQPPTTAPGTSRKQISETQNTTQLTVPIFLTSSRSNVSSAQSELKPEVVNNGPLRDKRLLQQFILKQQEGIFLPDISKSPKFLINHSGAKSNIKDELHNIFEYYTGSNSSSTNSSPYHHATSSSMSNTNSNYNNPLNRSLKQEHLNSNGLNKKPNKSIIHKLATDTSNKSKEVTFNLK